MLSVHGLHHVGYWNTEYVDLGQKTFLIAQHHLIDFGFSHLGYGISIIYCSNYEMQI